MYGIIRWCTILARGQVSECTKAAAGHICGGFSGGVRPGAAQRGGCSPLRIGLFLSRTLPNYQRLIKFYGMIKNNDNQNLKNITKYRCCMVSKHLI